MKHDASGCQKHYFLIGLLLGAAPSPGLSGQLSVDSLYSRLLGELTSHWTDDGGEGKRRTPALAH